jgi:hypothetical protein
MLTVMVFETRSWVKISVLVKVQLLGLNAVERISLIMIYNLDV